MNDFLYTVYCLAERTGCWHVRYIGITKQRLRKRLHGHMWDAKRPYRQEHKANWIRKCVADCVPIRIRAIRSNLTLEAACTLERALIARYRSQLVNIHEGGTSGYAGLPSDAKLRHASNTRAALESVYTRHGGKSAFYDKLHKLGVAAQKRKRIAESESSTECGRIVFSGLMFGGGHVICLLVSGDDHYLRTEIDGIPYRPLTERGLRKLLARRIA